MDKPKNRVTVVIMGEEYTVKSTFSPESMHRAARLVEQLLSTLSERHVSRSSHKLAILAALNLGHQLLAQREECPEEERREKCPVEQRGEQQKEYREEHRVECQPRAGRGEI